MFSRSFKNSTLGLILAGLTMLPAIAGATPLGIVNGDFETQDLTGWTASSPAFGATDHTFTNLLGNLTPASHTWYASGRANGPTGIHNPSNIMQMIDFSAYSSEINNGYVSVNLHGYGFGETGQDKGVMRLSFLDASDLVIGTVLESVYAETSAVWTELSIGTTVLPYGTDKLMIELMAMKHPGNDKKYTDVGFDDITGNFYIDYPQNPPAPSTVPEPGTILLLGTGIVGLAAWRRKK